MVEGARLESEYTSKAYRGFESLPLRHTFLSTNRFLTKERRFIVLSYTHVFLGIRGEQVQLLGLELGLARSVASLSHAVDSPGLHQLASLVESRLATIGAFAGGPDNVR